MVRHLITHERLLVKRDAHLARHPGRALPDSERRQSTNTSSATPAAAMIDNMMASARRLVRRTRFRYWRDTAGRNLIPVRPYYDLRAFHHHCDEPPVDVLWFSTTECKNPDARGIV